MLVYLWKKWESDRKTMLSALSFRQVLAKKWNEQVFKVKKKTKKHYTWYHAHCFFLRALPSARKCMIYIIEISGICCYHAYKIHPFLCSKEKYVILVTLICRILVSAWKLYAAYYLQGRDRCLKFSYKSRDPTFQCFDQSSLLSSGLVSCGIALNSSCTLATLKAGSVWDVRFYILKEITNVVFKIKLSVISANRNIWNHHNLHQGENHSCIV
jgi:hypothetical protein